MRKWHGLAGALKLGEILTLGKDESDPVVQYKSGWYFWDENWLRCYGPHQTEEEARKAVMEYAKTL